MKLNELSANPGSRPVRLRVGRGIGSGKGKTAGRGVKGQKSRSGVAIKGFEGGQMPIYRRLPKRGFHNLFRRENAVVNLDRLQGALDAGKLDAKETITVSHLQAAGLVRAGESRVRLLARGTLKVKLNLTIPSASKAAVAAVEAAGGAVSLTAPVPAAEPDAAPASADD